MTRSEETGGSSVLPGRTGSSVLTHLGEAEREFRCCDTTFTVRATGWRARRSVDRARERARRLEARLNAFDEDSAVARLNDRGWVEDEHVARVVRRGLEYHERTGGAFDVRRGEFEHDLKAYIGGDTDRRPSLADAATAAVTVDGDRVETDAPLDLNGLAKGYLVDRTYETIDAAGRRGFVDGGGDVAGQPGPVGVESPYGDERPLKVLATDWNVASSGGYRRRRGEYDHVYDPVEGEVGTGHDLVTVVAKRDCTEADALATTLSALSLDRALELVEGWDGAEALVVHEGVFETTEGFDDHVHP